jgi:NitT/TauT family transport system ATP-binding protein
MSNIDETEKATPEPEGSSATPSTAKVCLTNVSKTFQSATQTVEALTEMNLEIREGEFVVLFGPSGCGKSTLLNLIAGFDVPSGGEVLFEGNPVTGPGRDRLMLFQEHGLFPWLNVIRNVMYGLKNKQQFRFRPRKQREIAYSWLEMMHLEEFATSLVHELSGGMKQRVALARAFAPEPHVLLIDEPFPALDALTKAQLYGDLQEILIRTGKTIISVTHDPREAVCLGDRVIVLTPRPGRIQKEIHVDLPRPRDIYDPAISEYVTQIMTELEAPPDEK